MSAHGLVCAFELDEYASDLLLGQLPLIVRLYKFIEISLLAMLKHKIQIMGGLLEIDQLHDVFMLDDPQCV